MDKKKKRKIIRISVIVAIVVILIVVLVILAGRKKTVEQFKVDNTDVYDFNPFVESEKMSDNSMLEYGKVLNKYNESGYALYSGEDIAIDAANFYGISYTALTGETVYLYRTADSNGKFSGEPTSVVYRGKTYTYSSVVNGSESFASADFIAEMKDKLAGISNTEDYTAEKYVDIAEGRDENGYTTAADAEKRYKTETYTIDANAKTDIKVDAGEEITFIYDVTKLVDQDKALLYSADIEYFLPKNRQNTALLEFKVDSKYPFKEAANIELKRFYAFYDVNSLDVGFDENNTNASSDERNEIRAQQQEIFAWNVEELKNPEGLYKNPYKFVIQPGKTATAEKPRTISITLSREPACIRKIILKAPVVTQSYEEYKAANGFSESAIVKDADNGQVQFEVPVIENSVSLRSEWDGNYCTVPASYEVTRYNYFGGDRWASGGDSASWNFTVNKTGWYQIGFRYKTTLTDIVAFREIKINGEILFDALEEYCFPYADDWHAASLMDENQQPFYFYFEQGKTYTIQMTSKVGPLRKSVQSLTEAMDSISNLINTVVSITGAVRSESGGYSVDKNRDWDLDKYIVGIQDEIDSYKDVFTNIYNDMKTYNGGVLPYYGSAVSVAKVLFERLSKDLEDIPSSLNDIADSLSSLSTTLQTITEQPLAIDYMVVNGGEYDYSKCTSNAWQNLKVGAIQFMDSFTKDYSLLGTRDVTTQTDREIEVYVGRGREYVEMLKSLVAEDFTPKTGIKVKINMVSGVEGLVMLRYVTGNAPDVALTVGIGATVDYACRGALTAFNDLDGDGVDDNPDFEKLKEEYLDGAFTLSRYQGDYYSVPETQTCQLLFYRTDILEELGLEVPNTWDDVYEMLPTLQENGMDFCYNYGVGNLYPFIYQKGASFYDENGLESTLLSDEAYEAFAEYSELYTKYNIPYAANFYMKFKMGDMPIGIADLSTYCQLKYSAPEIEGKWAIAPVPGHVATDDEGNEYIDRTCGGSASCCVLINNYQRTGDLEQTKAAYKFVEWWLGKETQIAYAAEVEATFGVASRWLTANVDAIESMAYSDEEVAVIKEQWKYFEECPNVLGGYYTSRYLTTALNQAVLQGDNIRIALEDAVREINKEMERKQAEFFPDWFDSNGNRKDAKANNYSIIWKGYKEGE